MTKEFADEEVEVELVEGDGQELKTHELDFPKDDGDDQQQDGLELKTYELDFPEDDGDDQQQQPPKKPKASALQRAVICALFAVVVIALCMCGLLLVYASTTDLPWQEKKALQSFWYDCEPSFSWRKKQWWFPWEDPCGDGWYGVTCNSEGTHVLELDLSSTALRCAVPASLSALHELRVLDLTNNRLWGSIPSEYRELKKLTSLRLTANKISGKIPSFIGKKMKNLHILELGRCNLTGSIPESIAQLRNLTRLNLGDNNFDHAPFPEFLTTLNQSLTYLTLSSHNFSGSSIPSDFFEQMSHLTQLSLASCSLSGTIPLTLPPLPSTSAVTLNNLDLSDNLLLGSIPTNIFQRGVKSLNLSYNFLEGSVPALYEARDLFTLDLTHNRLEANLPDEFGGLRKLNDLLVAFNSLSGTFPSSLVHSQLTRLNFSHNQFYGPVPHDVWVDNRHFEIDLSFNAFNGTLPLTLPDENDSWFDNDSTHCPEFFSINVNLRGNRFGGPVPQWVCYPRRTDFTDNVFDCPCPTLCDTDPENTSDYRYHRCACGEE